MGTTFDLRKVLGLEEDKEIIINKKYIENLINYYKNIDDNEEFLRTERCAKHILAAIAFRENAKSTFEKTQSVFLPSIGNYYAYFHLSIAMLSLDYGTPTNKLEKLRHTQLQKLVKSNLEERGIINESHLKIMLWLKEVREISNYSINPYLYDSTGFLQDDLYDKQGMYNLMEKSFQDAINFIHFVTKKVSDYRECFSDRIESFIADSQGNDILMIFFSKDDEEIIEKYLEEQFYPGLR
jgi:hypothetical protein